MTVVIALFIGLFIWFILVDTVYIKRIHLDKSNNVLRWEIETLPRYKAIIAIKENNTHYATLAEIIEHNLNNFDKAY